MYLRDDKGTSKPVIHIFDSGNKFSAAAFLPNMKSATIWNTFLHIWATTYIGFPESMLTDQGSVFFSDEWNNACEITGISLRHPGRE